MKTHLAMPLFAATLTVALAAYVSACSQSTDSAGAPAASTTVGTEIDDGVLTTRIKSALLDDATVKSFDLKVETRKGEVLLSGFVDNASQMERAVAVTRAISGVKNIDNKMSLKGSDSTVGNKVDDAVITTKVKSALLADTSIKSLDIAVVTRKGEVQLSGFVNNQGQIENALKLVSSIEGVRLVDNKMSVKK